MKNRETNKILFKLLALIILIIITFYFITKIYLEIIKSPLILDITIGSNNLNIILTTIVLFFIGWGLLFYLNKKVNKKFIISEIFEFVFLTMEVTIIALVGLAIFIGTKSTNSATLIDIIGRPIYFICIAFFLFLIIRIIKFYLIEKDIIKSYQ